MIEVTSVKKDNFYGSKVDIHGNHESVLIELKTLFEAIIQSEHPETIHAVIAYYLPKITEQIATNSISESKLSYYMHILESMAKGGVNDARNMDS